MAKFILVRCKFAETSPNETMLEDMGVTVNPTIIEDYLCLDLDDISCFNPSSEGETTVALKNGERFQIAISFPEFAGIIHTNVSQILEVVKR